jgi:gliding motility-associated-like protein
LSKTYRLFQEIYLIQGVLFKNWSKIATSMQPFATLLCHYSRKIRRSIKHYPSKTYKTMNYSKNILAGMFFSLAASYSFGQTVDASPETQTICSGSTANLTAVIVPSGTSSLPTTSYAVSSIAYTPFSYTTGTISTQGDDTQGGPYPIGFSFSFFGNCYTQFYIGSNGWVSFSPTTTSFTPGVVPSTSAPENAIMGPWQDWYPGLGTNVVRYQTVGVAPNRKLVVSWNNCPMYSCTSTTGTFQIVLYESTNVIENYLQQKLNCAGWFPQAVEGIQNATGTTAFVVPGRNGTTWTASNEGWRWTPNGVFTPTISWYVLPTNTLLGTGPSITVTPPAGAASTLYYASITGGSGCGSANSTDTVVVNQTIVPAITAGNNGPICAGSTLNLTCTPTVAGATYSWTGPGGFTSSLQNPTRPAATIFMSGTYTVNISVAGCPGIPVTTNVTINPVPAAPVAAATTPICSGSTLNLSTTSAGPTWSWTGPGGFTSSLQNPSVPSATTAASGTYSVTVTSAAGCTSSPGTVNVTVNPTPAAPTASNQSICYGMTATLTASGSGPTYEWYNAPGGTLLGTGSSFTTPPITSTTNYYVQTNAAGCIGPMTTVTVNVAPSLTANAGPDDSICSGASYTLGATPTGAGYTYTWDAPGTPGFSTSATPSVTPASTTTYTVTIADALGCTGTDMVTITVGSPLLVNPTSVPASCFGSCNGTASTSASGSFGSFVFDWSPGSPVGDGTANISALCAGSYTVMVTDLIGCTASGTTTVTEPTALSLTSSTTTAHCGLPDGSATVNATGSSGSYSYLWSDGQIVANAVNLAPGTYTVTVTDVVNGCTATTTATVPNTPGVTSTITSSNVTCNSACDGTASVTASTGVTPYSYSWSPGGQITPAITGLCPGTYTCTITDASGCTVTSSATITQPAAIVIDPIPAVTICQGQSTTLNATATGGHLGGYTFNWNAPPFTGPSNTVSPSATTTYTVTALDTAGCASQSPVTVTVTVNPPLSVTASANVSICPGSSTTLTATPGGGNGTYSYSWMPGAGTGSTFNVSPSATTTYTITVTDGCTTTPATATVTVTILPLPVVTFSPASSSGCSPLCVTFADGTTVAGGSVTSWLWGFGDGSTSAMQNPTHCFNAIGAVTNYDVTLTATSNGGCTSTATLTSAVTVYGLPTAAFTFNPQPASLAAPEISFTDLSTNATSWSWNFADPINTLEPNTSNAENPSHTYADAGTFCVTLIASNIGGCADTTVNCVTIDPEFTLYIPNAFTPDGDGLNDVFAPKGDNIAEFTMRIFDRWGNMIFVSKALNEGWDGKVKGGSGEVAQEDVYVYNIEVKENTGGRKRYIGHVTIVK